MPDIASICAGALATHALGTEVCRYHQRDFAVTICPALLPTARISYVSKLINFVRLYCNYSVSLPLKKIFFSRVRPLLLGDILLYALASSPHLLVVVVGYVIHNLHNWIYREYAYLNAKCLAKGRKKIVVDLCRRNRRGTGFTAISIFVD